MVLSDHNRVVKRNNFFLSKEKAEVSSSGLSNIILYNRINVLLLLCCLFFVYLYSLYAICLVSFLLIVFPVVSFLLGIFEQEKGINTYNLLLFVCLSTIISIIINFYTIFCLLSCFYYPFILYASFSWINKNKTHSLIKKKVLSI